MDLSFSKEEVAFRDEVRDFFKNNVPPETRKKMVEGRHLSKDEMVAWWRILNKKGWGVLALAEGIWRHRLDARCSTTSSTKSCRCIRRRRRSPSASAWSAR